MRKPVIAGSTVFLLLCLFYVSCRSYVSESFLTKTADHEKIAVLPYKVITTGRLPNDLSEEELLNIQIAESEIFQASLVSQLLTRDSRRKNRELKVSVLSKAVTNSILLENGISIPDSWDENPSELAHILGVDAVVLSTVHKTRYLSNLESFGVDVVENVLRDFDIYPPMVGGGFSKTNDIRIETTIVNRSDGGTLFGLTETTEIDWSETTEQIVDQVNRKVSRLFPYFN